MRDLYNTDFLRSLRTRELSLGMLADAVSFWRRQHRLATTCCAFRCFNKEGMPESILQLKKILDNQCPEWEDREWEDRGLEGCSIDKDELKKALKFIIRSREKRGSRSSRNERSITSIIFSEILNSVDFRGDNKSIYKDDDSKALDARLCLSDENYYKSIIGDLEAMKDDVPDYTDCGYWRKEAYLTINGLICFCRDYNNLKSAYEKIMQEIKGSVGSLHDIYLKEPSKGRLQCSVGPAGEIIQNLYDTNIEDDKYSVAYHLELYKSFEDFSSATRVVFQQVLKSYQIASERKQSSDFFVSLYGQYCIDTRVDKVFGEFLAPENFVEDSYKVISPIFHGACAYILLIGLENDFSNILKLLTQSVCGEPCLYKSEFKNIDQDILKEFLGLLGYIDENKNNKNNKNSDEELNNKPLLELGMF